MRYSLHEIDSHDVVATTIAADRDEALEWFSQTEIEMPQVWEQEGVFCPWQCLRGDLQEGLTKRALPFWMVGIKLTLGYSVLPRNENRYLQCQQRQ